MKTLHTAYRVSDLARSMTFYETLGYEAAGRVTTGDGSTLVMLMLPGNSVVGLELVSDPRIEALEVGNGFSHLVVEIEDLQSVLSRLATAGIETEGEQLPGGPDGPRTSFLYDPDGYRIELVQWPPGQAQGLTREAFR
jgi:lactoylglutathione lyase